MDSELKAYLDERFGRMDERFGRMEERFERVETAIRHTQVSVEALRSDVHLVAEGVMGVTERLEAFQAETALNFEKTRASIVPHYQNLDERVRILEARADRQTGDVLDAIRKKFGKSQA
jgi:uncharacterized protein Yka (UPF0111/DUF47 family)